MDFQTLQAVVLAFLRTRAEDLGCARVLNGSGFTEESTQSNSRVKKKKKEEGEGERKKASFEWGEQKRE